MKKYFVLFAILVLFAGLFYSTLDPHTEEYNKLMSQIGDDTQTAYVAKQQRDYVQKEFWFEKGDQLYKMCLRSKDSQLMLDHNGASTEVIENMQDLDCFLQEDLFLQESQPMQVVRHIQAEKGTYHYKQNRMIAENVQIHRYILPGHEFTQNMEKGKLVMDGQAKIFQFSWEQNHFKFSAEGFKATLHNSN